MDVKTLMRGADIHLWFFDTDATPDEKLTQRYLAVLSNRERDRLSRFRFNKNRQNYLISHAMCREVLSSYTGIESGSLEYHYSEQGKPDLKWNEGKDKVQFNLSHSGDLSVLGITGASVIGVDIESGKNQSLKELIEVARHSFAEPELRLLNDISNEVEWKKLFLTIWTLKESFIKATGHGLSIPLDRFCFIPGRDGRLAITIDHSISACSTSSGWRFWVYGVGNAHFVAVCQGLAGVGNPSVIEFRSSAEALNEDQLQPSLLHSGVYYRGGPRNSDSTISG